MREAWLYAGEGLALFLCSLGLTLAAYHWGRLSVLREWQRSILDREAAGDA